MMELLLYVELTPESCLQIASESRSFKTMSKSIKVHIFDGINAILISAAVPLASR